MDRNIHRQSQKRYGGLAEVSENFGGMNTDEMRTTPKKKEHLECGRIIYDMI